MKVEKDVMSQAKKWVRRQVMQQRNGNKNKPA